MRLLFFLSMVSALALLAACSSPSYTYHYIPGHTAELHDGVAFAPPSAPAAVQAAVAAANRIAGAPYDSGGGHRSSATVGFDCSGATSTVLREAGLLADSMPSAGFRHYGESGEGEWITVYARRGHVFLSIAGVRFDTGWHPGPRGPRWTTSDRPADGCILRHPPDL